MMNVRASSILLRSELIYGSVRFVVLYGRYCCWGGGGDDVSFVPTEWRGGVFPTQGLPYCCRFAQSYGCSRFRCGSEPAWQGVEGGKRDN